MNAINSVKLIFKSPIQDKIIPNTGLRFDHLPQLGQFSPVYSV